MASPSKVVVESPVSSSPVHLRVRGHKEHSYFQALVVSPAWEAQDLQPVGATKGARSVAHWASSQGVGSVNPVGSPQSQAAVCRYHLLSWG